MLPLLGSPAFGRLLALSCVVLSATSCAPAERPAESGRLGTVNFSTSCRAGLEDDFNRAVALLHHMTYPAAEASFRDVAERDPDCAMAYWALGRDSAAVFI